MNYDDALPFWIETHTPDESKILQLLAQCSTPTIAEGAYEAAREQYPKAHIPLSHKAQIVKRSGADPY